MELKSRTIACPHCGHHVHITLDASNGDQSYYEDCTACCRGIHFNLHINEVEKKIELQIDADDEQVY